MSGGNTQSSIKFATGSDRSTMDSCFHLWKSLLGQPAVVTTAVIATRQTWSKSFAIAIIELLD